MSDDEPETGVGGALSALGADKVVPMVYVDALQPTVQVVGRGLVPLGELVARALRPVTGLVWGYDQMEAWLIGTVSKKLADRKAKTIQPPPLNVAGPAIMQMQFTEGDSQLRDMYANLLASSIDKNTASGVHPAFVQIISQLTPDEAKILQHLSTLRHSQVCVEYEAQGAMSRVFGSSDVHTQWKVLCGKAGVELADSHGAYLDNLARLRLVEIKGAPDDGPASFGRYLGPRQPPVKRSLDVTDFGKRFIAACIADANEACPTNPDALAVDGQTPL